MRTARAAHQRRLPLAFLGICVIACWVACAMIYGGPKTGDGPPRPGPRYEGAVRAHPDLELLFEREHSLWMDADLAVIFLSEEVMRGLDSGGVQHRHDVELQWRVNLRLHERVRI